MNGGDTAASPPLAGWPAGRPLADGRPASQVRAVLRKFGGMIAAQDGFVRTGRARQYTIEVTVTL